MQVEIQYMREMNVHTLCKHGAVKEQGSRATAIQKSRKEEHEFMQDPLREPSLEIYVINTGGFQSLEC